MKAEGEKKHPQTGCLGAESFMRTRKLYVSSPSIDARMVDKGVSHTTGPVARHAPADSSQYVATPAPWHTSAHAFHTSALIVPHERAAIHRGARARADGVGGGERRWYLLPELGASTATVRCNSFIISVCLEMELLPMLKRATSKHISNMMCMRKSTGGYTAWEQ
jgi:hypothetical protein